MTVRLCTAERRYQGLSTDDKPTAPTEGSTYHAVDTGETWVFFDGMWELDLRLQTAFSAA